MRRVLAAMALCALSSSGLFAAGACTGATSNGGNTLTIYSSAPSGGDINNATISNGQLLTLDSVGNCVVAGSTFSNFQVDGGVGFVGTIPFDLGLTVVGGTQAQFNYTNLGNGDIELFFQASPGITQLTLEDGSATSITENVCSAALSAPNTTCPSTTQLAQLNTNGTGQSIDGPVSIGSVSTDFIVETITGGGNNTQGIGSGVPEPMTLSLMGIGLLGIGFLGGALAANRHQTDQNLSSLSSRLGLTCFRGQKKGPVSKDSALFDSLGLFSVTR